MTVAYYIASFTDEHGKKFHGEILWDKYHQRQLRAYIAPHITDSLVDYSIWEAKGGTSRAAMETLAAKTGYETGLKEYVDRERAAVDLINSVDQLMYARGVELVFFRNHLLDISISEVIKLFTYASEVVKKPIDVFMTADVARGLLELDLAPSKIDIGRLTHEFKSSKSTSALGKFGSVMALFLVWPRHRTPIR